MKRQWNISRKRVQNINRLMDQHLSAPMRQQRAITELERREQARTATGTRLEQFVYHSSREVLEALMENPCLGEQHLLLLLSRKNLAREIIVKIASNRKWMAGYDMKLAIARHPRTPRHVALPLLKFIYVFDLLGIAVNPAVPVDLKRSAESAMLSLTEGLALGQRISLARRGPVRVAAGLLADRHRAVLEAALSNPYLTEQSVASALMAEQASPTLADAVLHHRRWNIRHFVRLALVRSQHLSLARLLQLIPELTTSELADLVSDRRVAPSIRAYALRIQQAPQGQSRERPHRAGLHR